MPPDQGCYEERYRLTYPVARGFAFSVVPLIIAIFSHQTLPWVILSPVAFVLATVPWLGRRGQPQAAFRADMTGIMLGADPLSWPFRHASAVFVPWSDAEGIALYQGGGPPGGRWLDDPCIGIGAAQMPRPCPAVISPPAAARSLASRSRRPVTAWRLDRDRLAALTAAVAPGIPIIDASTGPKQDVEGPGQASTVTQIGPAD